MDADDSRQVDLDHVEGRDIGASTRTIFTLDERIARRAQQLSINISAAARQGVADAVRDALLEADREAYRKYPETANTVWAEAEVWGDV